MPAGFRKMKQMSRKFYNKHFDEVVCVELWKDGSVRIVGEFGKDLGESKKGFEPTCEEYLRLGYEEY